MATVLPFSRSAHNPHDDAARAYIASLKSGTKPEIRPDLGEWSPLIAYLDVTFDRSEGNIAVMNDTLTGLLRSKRFPGLAELLALNIDEPPQIEIVSDPGLMPPLPEQLHCPAGYSAQAGRWLDEYVSFSQQYSPESFPPFHVAGGLFVLSVVAARRVRIPFNRRDYTPLMIIQCSNSGLYKKTTAAEAAYEVLEAAGLEWLYGADKTSPQKLLSDMAGTLPRNYMDLDEQRQNRVKQRIAMSGQRGWYLDEFGKFVKSMTSSQSHMSDFQEILLVMDSCKNTYEYSTQARGSELIEKPYLPLLGSLTPPNIRSNARAGAEFWTDGFWGRFAFVCAPEGQFADSAWGVGEIPVPYSLSDALRRWHYRLGVPAVEIVPKLDKDGKATDKPPDVVRGELPEVRCVFGDGVHAAWQAYRSALKSIIAGWTLTDLNSSYDRLAVKAMRIAALFASLENNNVIELWHWARAQEIAESWRASLHELYRQVNTNVRETQSAQLENEILRQIAKFSERKNVGPSVTDLQNYMKRYSRKEIDEALKALVKAGVLEVERTSHTVRYNFLKIETTYSEDLAQVQGYGGVR